MCKLMGLSLVFCLGLGLTSASVRADEGDGYLIKLKTHPNIGKLSLVQEQTTMHSHSKLVGREGKKILENNEDKQTQFYKFRETILEQPKGQDS